MELGDRDPRQYHSPSYSRLNQDDPVYTPPPGYNPAPNTFTQPPPSSQQSSSNNVVVVSQPSSQPEITTVIERTRPNDYLLETLCLMVVCCVLANPMAFILLIPALILSLSSGCASNAGDYDTAQRYGRVASYCALSSVLIYVAGAVIIIILTILFFTVGLTLVNV